MAKLFKQAVEKVQALPADMQDQAARMLLAYAGDEERLVELTPERDDEIVVLRFRHASRNPSSVPEKA
jgi:hypothetical protein